MSADSFIVFYGLRYESSIENAEDESHPLIKAAKNYKLNYYSSNFGGLDERYLIFVGTRLGILGLESNIEVILSSRQLSAVMETTKDKLTSAGFSEEPALYLQWQQDI